MTATSHLLSRVADHCSRTGIAETTFGLRVANDGKIIPRLRAGGSITLKTLEKIEAFLSTAEAPASAETNAREAAQ